MCLNLRPGSGGRAESRLDIYDSSDANRQARKVLPRAPVRRVCGAGW
jgi:hypothetical protein